jgi:hypothetical protein
LPFDNTLAVRSQVSDQCSFGLVLVTKRQMKQKVFCSGDVESFKLGGDGGTNAL